MGRGEGQAKGRADSLHQATSPVANRVTRIKYSHPPNFRDVQSSISSSPSPRFLPNQVTSPSLPPRFPPLFAMEKDLSDVEMAAADAREEQASGAASSASSTTTSPRPSPPAHHYSPPVDIDSRASSASLVPPPVVIDAASSSEAASTADGARGRKSKPSSSNVAAAPPGAKPKSTKSAVPRASSPSPPPPPARQPLQTIRLDIQLGGPEDYEVNIRELAKATGQRPATPAPEPKPDTSDESDGDDEGGPKVDVKQQEQQPGKRRRKVSMFSTLYLRASYLADWRI